LGYFGCGNEQASKAIFACIFSLSCQQAKAIQEYLFYLFLAVVIDVAVSNPLKIESILLPFTTFLQQVHFPTYCVCSCVKFLTAYGRYPLIIHPIGIWAGSSQLLLLGGRLRTVRDEWHTVLEEYEPHCRLGFGRCMTSFHTWIPRRSDAANWAGCTGPEDNY